MENLPAGPIVILETQNCFLVESLDRNQAREGPVVIQPSYVYNTFDQLAEALRERLEARVEK